MITRRQASISNASLTTPSTIEVVQLSPNHLNKKMWSAIIISQQTLKIILNLVTDNGELAMITKQVAIIGANLNVRYRVLFCVQCQCIYHHRLFLQFGNITQRHLSFHQPCKAH